MLQKKCINLSILTDLSRLTIFIFQRIFSFTSSQLIFLCRDKNSPNVSKPAPQPSNPGHATPVTYSNVNFFYRVIIFIQPNPIPKW
jgi:hypothetical protein